MAEEERIAKLRQKVKLETTDETKRRANLKEEEQETTRFCVKGASWPPPLWAELRRAAARGSAPPHSD